MRQVALTLLGLLLLAVNGALGRILHLELMRPDVVLLLNVFIGLNLKATEGALMVFVLGVASDSFAGTPMGMFASIHLLIFVLVRWSVRLLMPERRGIQLLLLLVMSLLSSLLSVLFLALVKFGTGPIWTSLKAMIPLALVHLLLAVPVWSLARWICPTASKERRAVT